METDCIHYKDSGFFSKIVLDYLDDAPELSPFYKYKAEITSFKQAIQERSFSEEKRVILSTALSKQYDRGNIKLKKEGAVALNIQSIVAENTFTVTTGHQLNLFTGPLYFIYKIVSTIKLSQKLSKTYPDQNFVPVYWMATEDHDFEEISFFRFNGKKIQWKTKQEGAVGRMKTAELQGVFEEFKELLTPYAGNAEALKDLFESAYLKHENLSDATRYLVHELFQDHGLLILDGDDVQLKQLFIPQLKAELKEEISSKLVAEQNEQLGKHYKIQVNPRSINLFYLEEGSRKRIVKEGDTFFIHETELKFSEREFLDILENHPERFSPNVLLRPLYQEVILPNLAYIGGGGELAYWFQLKSTFEYFKTPLPVLFLRNSALWMDGKTKKYFNALKLNAAQLFLEEGVLLKSWVMSNAKLDLSLQSEIEKQQIFFEGLSENAAAVDATLKPHVLALAEKQKQLLEQPSDKMIRAERRKQTVAAKRIHHIKEILFPNNSLQERTDNFSLLYMAYGDKMIDKLMDVLELPSREFVVLSDKTKGDD